MGKKNAIVSVKVIKGDINRALKKFKRGVSESEHLLELRERQYYKKPTTIRRRQKQLAVREQWKQTILEKIEGGDTTVKMFTKKKKKKKGSKTENKNKSTKK